MKIEKNRQRHLGNLARNQQSERDALGSIINARWMSMPWARQADSIMIYVGCRSEVDTRSAIEQLLDGGKRVIVPYCTQDETGQRKLGLWRLKDLSELMPGMWGILEPPKSRRGEPAKEVHPDEIDLFIVPGVAFDRNGGRLGNGAGYYDRLLASVRADAVLCGVCYESQLFDEVDTEAHDVRMDCVVTETTVYFNPRSTAFVACKSRFVDC